MSANVDNQAPSVRSQAGIYASGKGGGKAPGRIYRLCQHDEGLGELLVSLVPLFPRSLTPST